MLDTEFSDCIIENSRFVNLGNYAIDISEITVEIKNMNIDKAGDKGLSAGEASQMNISSIQIRQSAIAVASKDDSHINIKELTLRENTVGFAVFQKKPEFGPASVMVNQLKDSQKDKVYLVEESSSLLLNGYAVPANNNKVKKLLYGAEYGKATIR